MLVYEDQGSGAFINLACFGAHAEPTVAESLRGGCDLVSFSGDKLLGGPQAGIVVGSKQLIDRLKKNPLARAMRLDKMTLAALEATLRLYLDPERALASIPTLRMLSEPDGRRARARRAPGRRPAQRRARRLRVHRGGPRGGAGRRRRAAAVRHPHVRGERLVRARRRAGMRGLPRVEARGARHRSHQARGRAAGRAHHRGGRHRRDRRGGERLLRGVGRCGGVGRDSGRGGGRLPCPAAPAAGRSAGAGA